MAAAGIGNPAGAIVLADYGAPQIIGGKVRNEIISGGVFVFASGASGVVSSGTNSFTYGDILFSRDASGGQFNGICLQTTDVSGPISVLTAGAVIVVANGTVTAGTTVICDGNNSVTGATTAGRIVGRALTEGASGGYCIVNVGQA